MLITKKKTGEPFSPPVSYCGYATSRGRAVSMSADVTWSTSSMNRENRKRLRAVLNRYALIG